MKEHSESTVPRSLVYRLEIIEEQLGIVRHKAEFAGEDTIQEWQRLIRQIEKRRDYLLTLVRTSRSLPEDAAEENLKRESLSEEEKPSNSSEPITPSPKHRWSEN